MLDLFFIAITILFFVAGWAFVKGCDRLYGRSFMEYVLSLVVAAGVAVYLFYALLRPERF